MNKIISDNISLSVNDGTGMNAFTAVPSGKALCPGIMVFHEAFGVNDYIRDVTNRFANLGFIAIAPELFHRTEPGFEGSYTDFESTRKHIVALTEDGLVSDINAAYNWIKQHKRAAKDNIASIGFCLGGRVSFLANISTKLKAAVSFYGSNMPQYLKKIDNIEAPQLFFWGGLDSHIGEDQISTVTGALKEKGKNFVNVIFSNANHGFFCDARSSYNPEASKNAWALTTSFLETYLDSQL